MALTPQPAFSVDATVGFGATQTTNNVALPGTLASDTVVRVANLGRAHCAVALGAAGVVATNQSLIVPAGQVQYLGLGTATHLAALAIDGPTAILNVSTGN